MIEQCVGVIKVHSPVCKKKKVVKNTQEAQQADAAVEDQK